MRAALVAVCVAALCIFPARAQEVTQMPSPMFGPTRYCPPVTVSVTPGTLVIGPKRVVVSYPCARVGDLVDVIGENGVLLGTSSQLQSPAEVLTAGQVTLTFSAFVIGINLTQINVRMWARGQ